MYSYGHIITKSESKHDTLYLVNTSETNIIFGIIGDYPMKKAEKVCLLTFVQGAFYTRVVLLNKSGFKSKAAFHRVFKKFDTFNFSHKN